MMVKAAPFHRLAQVVDRQLLEIVLAAASVNHDLQVHNRADAQAVVERAQARSGQICSAPVFRQLLGEPDLMIVVNHTASAGQDLALGKPRPSFASNQASLAVAID